MKRYRAPFMLIPCFLIMLILTAGCSAIGKPNNNGPDVNTSGHREKKTKFDKAVMHDRPVCISSSLSPDGRAASLLFNHLEAKIDPKDKGVRVKTNTATFILPVIDNDKELQIKQDIRGFVCVAQGTRAVLLAQMGGKTILIDLPQSSSGGEDFTRTFETTLSAGQDCQGTFFLLVERDSDDEKKFAHLAIDSIDITMKEQNTGKK
ncbi:MAG: hypothetical protein HUU08_17135 [Candidatus Brocadia sp.]|nr:hypothetical protein [Candidatus Brocadia sp.]